MKGFLRSRKFRQGTMATAITAAVCALVLVLNFIVTSVTNRHSLILDLTPTKLFSLTDETKAYLSELEKDVTITVMDTEETFAGRSDYYLQVAQVLRQFALASERITLEFVDMVSNPAIAQDYPDIQLYADTILITCGERVRNLNPSDLYDYTTNLYGESVPAASTAEQVLTSAVLGVTSDTVYNVAVITGHGEENISPFTAVLENNNYRIGEVNLSTGDIDPVYDIAIIAAPERDYTAEELRRLDSFLDNNGSHGKTLLYLASTVMVDLPGLDAFLEDWGVAVDGGIVAETDTRRVYSMYGMPDYYIAALDYAESTYSQSTAAAGKAAVAAYGRPMEVLFANKGSVYVATLLQYATSAGVVISDSEVQQSPEPIPHMTISQWMGASGASTVLVCGSSAFVDNIFISNPNFANSDYMLGLLADLIGKEDLIRIQSKSLAGATLDMPAMQAIVLGVVLIVAFPLAVLIFGLVVWARRRHR